MLVYFAFGFITSLGYEDKPYPLDLVRRLWRDRGQRQGTVGDPFTMEAAYIDLTLKGPDLSEIFPLLGGRAGAADPAV